MMQIVIDIPDGCYEELTTESFPIQDAYRLVAWIKDGTPLPKGHGDLVDRNELLYWSYEIVSKYCEFDKVVNVTDIKAASTIIEADKEGSGDA